MAQHHFLHWKCSTKLRSGPNVGEPEGGSQQLDGEVVVERLPWEDIALTNGALFASGLRDLGLPESDVADGASVLSQVASELAAIDNQIDKFRADIRTFMTSQALLDLYAQKRSVRARLSDWVNARTVHSDSIAHSTLRIPIFVLSAPPVDGCLASFATSRQLARNIDCRLTVYGSGISGGSRGACRAHCNFVVGPGDAKVVFVPAELTVGEVSVLSHGKVIGGGLQIQAIEFPDPEPAVALIPSDARPMPGAKIKTYPLADDTTGDISSYGYEYQQSNTAEFSLGAKALGVDINLKTEVTLDHSIELDYELKGGHDYTLSYLEKGQGITWRVEHR